MGNLYTVERRLSGLLGTYHFCEDLHSQNQDQCTVEDSKQNQILRAAGNLKPLRLINQCLCEKTPRKALTMFPTMLHLDDFVQILPDFLQYALSTVEIFSPVDAEHSYAIDELDNILVNVNRMNNEQ